MDSIHFTLAGLLILTTGVSLWRVRPGSGVEVVVAPDSTQSRRHRMLRWGSGIVSLALCSWVAPSISVEQPSTGFRFESEFSIWILPIFFLWMSLAGALDFAASTLWIGALVRPVRGAANAHLPSHRMIDSASRGAQALARRAPRIEPIAFFGVAMLSLLALVAGEDRYIHGDSTGLRIDGYFDLDPEHLLWSELESLDVEFETLSTGKRKYTLTWTLEDGSTRRLRTDSMWKTPVASVEQAIEYHREQGVPVRD